MDNILDFPHQAKPEEPAPFVPDHVDDDHWGKGGRYEVIDGVRVPVKEEPTEKEDNNG